MQRYEELYDLLLDYANLGTEVEQLLVGVNWTLCRAGSIGMAQTAGAAGVDGSVPIKGRTLAELSQWLRQWDPRQASIGLAAVNAAVNREADMVYAEGALFKGKQAYRSGFEWLAPKFGGQRVAVVGDASRYLAGIKGREVSVLPIDGAVSPQAEQQIPQADWVFLPASTIVDKTLPRLLELAQDSTCVLYGAELPWLDEWRQFGVDYLLGSQVDNADRLSTQIAEGLSDATLSDALSYRLISDTATPLELGAVRYG